jgi:hypothetical protein
MLLCRFHRPKGQTFGEYAVIVCGILILSLAALTVFGDKSKDMWATAAVVLPGAQGADNGPIVGGQLIEHTAASLAPNPDPITIDLSSILGFSGTERLGNNLFGLSPIGQGSVLPSLVIDF